VHLDSLIKKQTERDAYHRILLEVCVLKFAMNVTGHAMKLIYLVPPYDLLDQQTKSSLPLSVEEVTSRNLGYSVMVCMEGSTAHKLQTTPLISVNHSPNGKR
jgi:hypothetical protein